eukprot:CAMPEP_0176122330 /NCGR_PEP_ID=MMETSP0120_2-20121206/61608_1 /TAXON_ID=160619 /ORGANISM="Kryptoperidinium foliaceum, Strain CCMP 1326" /LENGTH=70 /DNA_ID=CAMNT_0017456949 /DNA_START=1 /DNA_END=210 /DNA_ORIENTATION=-
MTKWLPQGLRKLDLRLPQLIGALDVGNFQAALSQELEVLNLDLSLNNVVQSGGSAALCLKGFTALRRVAL